jgi:hypothetical protein
VNARSSPALTPSRGEAGSRRSQLCFIALAGVALTPVVLSAVRLAVSFRSRYEPVADHAIIELTLRAARAHPLFVGMPSRFGWNHPGPLLFYILAIPYNLLGQRSIGLQVGALLVNGAAIVAMAVVARRRGGLLLVLCTLIAIGATTHALGADFVRDPWPPYVSVLPFFLFVLLGWTSAAGDAHALPWAVGVGTFLVQTHVGYTPVVLAVLAWAVIALAARTYRPVRTEPSSAPERRRVARTMVISAIVGFVLWLPPLYDQLFRSHNLAKLTDYFFSGRQTAGLATAWRTMELQLGTRPEWVFGPRDAILGGLTPTTAASAFVVVLILAVVSTATAYALRRNGAMRAASVLAATLAITIVASLVAVSGIVGPVFVYLVRWTWAVGAAVGVLILWVAMLAVQSASTRATRLMVVGAAAIVVAINVAMSVDVFRLHAPQPDDQPLIHQLTSQLLTGLSHDRMPVLFTGGHGGLDEISLALQLERDGIPVRIADRKLASRLHVAHGTEGKSRIRVLRVVSGGDAALDEPQTGELVLARASQAPTAELRALEQALAAARRNGAPASVIRGLEALRAAKTPSTVVVFGRQG